MLVLLEIEVEPNKVGPEGGAAGIAVENTPIAEEADSVGGGEDVSSEGILVVDAQSSPLNAGLIGETPVVVQKDLRILSKFWSDEMDEEEEEEELQNPLENSALVQGEDPPFEVALSKSQRKKLRQKKSKHGKSDRHITRSRVGPRNYA